MGRVVSARWCPSHPRPGGGLWGVWGGREGGEVGRQALGGVTAGPRGSLCDQRR